jgi:putative ABC transport system permease protein
MSLSTVLSIALVVIVLLAFLAMAAGFRTTVAGTGSSQTAIVLAKGATSELNSAIDQDSVRRMEAAPGIARSGAEPLMSAENYVIVGARKAGSNADSNVTLRGIGPAGLAVRPQARLAAGRMFQPGSNEIVVGRSVAEGFAGLAVGKSIHLGAADWKVVGLFEADGTLFESEIWADSKLVPTMFGTANATQSIRARLTSPAAIAQVEAYLAANPTLKLSVRSEADYYAAQASATGNIIRYIGWPLGIAMAIGALAGALNTMYSSVATRGSEIATLRILGFGGFSIFVSTIAEATLLAALGGLLGLGLAYAFIDGLSASTLGSNLTQVMFRFDLSWAIAVQALVLALAVGLAGGILPAWRASRQNIPAGLAGV